MFPVALGTYGTYATFFLNGLVVDLMQTEGITRDHAAAKARLPGRVSSSSLTPLDPPTILIEVFC